MQHPKTYFALSMLFLAVCFSYSCKHKHHDITRGFYYWKTTYRPTTYELSKLRQLSVRKIYLRLFDVDYDVDHQRAIPVAPVRIDNIDSGFSYVPVIFITQKVLISMNDTAIGQVAKSICNLASAQCGRAGIHPIEVQIDCDWTAGTKGKYFAFLKVLKEQPFMKGKILSCTIRMNQVKYQLSSGIPPADRGLVMMYGMGNLKKPGAHNSILEADDAMDYLKYLDKYPLPLDVALPLFEWCTLFRDDQFRGILRDVTTDEVRTSGLFSHKYDNLYTSLYDTDWHGFKLRANDIVRTESTSYPDIKSIADFSAKQVNNKDVNVILFACDSITLSKFSLNELQTIYNSLQ